MRPRLFLAISLLLALPGFAQKPATPAPAAASSTAEIEAWLAKADAQYRAPYEKEVLAPYEAGRAEAKQRYLAILVPQFTAAAADARQADSDFLREERQRVFDGKGVPPTDGDKPPVGIVPGRAAYRAQIAKLDQDRARVARLHFDRYDKFLADTQATLAQRQRLEDVALLKAKREALAKEWLPGALAPTPPPSVAVKSTPAPRGPAADTSRAAVHETAEWLFEIGAEVFMAEGAKEVRVYDTKTLATSREGIVKVHIVNAKLTGAFNAADAKRLGALRGLRSVDIRGVDLDDESLAFLQSLENLESVSIWTANKVTDQVWDYLANHPKLKAVNLRNVKGLAGKTVDKLAGARELRAVELQNSAAGDETAAAISRLPQLDTVSLAKSKVTDAALPLLAKLPNLAELDLTATQVTPRGLAALKGLRRLERFSYLDAQMPTINDSVRAIVSNFPKLTQWRLSGDPVTAQAIETLAQVRIERLTVAGKSAPGALAGLVKIAGLTHLTLVTGDYTDAELEPLQNLRALKSLDCTGKGITDQFLEGMKKNRSLKEIRFGTTSVTPGGAAAYEKAVSGSKVWR